MPNTSSRDTRSKRRLEFVDDSDDGSGKQPTTASGRDNTPEQSAPTTTRKRGMEAFLSSPRAKKKQGAVVTPGANNQKTAVVTPLDERKAAAVFEWIPKYIHENVDYLSKGQAKLSPSTMQVFQWVEQRFGIPKDLEQNRSYGPLSGTSYEERVIRAHALGKLTAKDPADADVAICTSCATVGHMREDCPDLL
jgi:hypothetical protein